LSASALLLGPFWSKMCPSRSSQTCEVDTISAIGHQKRGVVNGQTSLISELLFSAVGVGYFIYGKKQRATVPLVCGLMLMIFPYFVSSTVLLMIIGVVLLALPYFVRL